MCHQVKCHPSFQQKIPYKPSHLHMMLKGIILYLSFLQDYNKLFHWQRTEDRPSILGTALSFPLIKMLNLGYFITLKKTQVTNPPLCNYFLLGTGGNRDFYMWLTSYKEERTTLYYMMIFASKITLSHLYSSLKHSWLNNCIICNTPWMHKVLNINYAL